jgi:hypothetical protein
MFSLLPTRLPEAAKAVAPLVAVVCVLQVLPVQAPAVLFVQSLAGSVLAMLGMLLLFGGIDVGILPMGRFIGAELPRHGLRKRGVCIACCLTLRRECWCSPRDPTRSDG